MQIPKDMFYTENHEWVLVEGKEGIVGITEYAQQEMGDVVFVELPEIGEKYEQEEPFGVVESVKAVSDIFIPIGGEVIDINDELYDQPELINEEPFEGGWLIKVKVTDEDETNSLMDADEYTRFLEEVE